MNATCPIAGSGRGLRGARLGTFLALIFAFLLGAVPRARAAVAVSETDFQTLRRLEYAEALCKARKMWARGDAAKIAAAEAELKQTWQDSGWTRDHSSEVDDAVGEVISNLRSLKNGEATEDDFKSAMSESDPATVATARAHYEEMQTVRDSERAEKQVREELEQARRGEIPTAAQLQGAWVFDLDGTIDAMNESFPVPDRDEFKAKLAPKIGSPSYAFGPGDQVVSRALGPDGKERADTGVYRLDGHKIFFKSPGGRNELEMDIGLRHGKLQMGTGFGIVVFARK